MQLLIAMVRSHVFLFSLLKQIILQLSNGVLCLYNDFEKQLSNVRANLLQGKNNNELMFWQVNSDCYFFVIPHTKVLLTNNIYFSFIDLL